MKRIISNEKDPVRKNIEDIADLRDAATHLVVEELESVYVGLFQAGVLNYIAKLKEWFGISVTEKISPAMLSLIFDIGKVNPVLLRKKHGKEIAEYFNSKSGEIESNVASLSDKNIVFQWSTNWLWLKIPKMLISLCHRELRENLAAQS